MAERDRLKELQALLHDMGGTHSLDDIRALIEMGELQSFGAGESWAVTTVIPFPQALVVDVFFIVGELKDFDELQKKIEELRQNIGATFMRVYGRPGFEYLIERRNWAPGQGWKKGPRVYTKRLNLH
jgi:hypothetical protein